MRQHLPTTKFGGMWESLVERFVNSLQAHTSAPYNTLSYKGIRLIR